MSEPIKNIVLVGCTGNGKSATGNTILGEKLFVSEAGAGGVTTKCEMYRAAIQDGPIINVIDTPGLFDSTLPADYITKEIINCLTIAEQGIHAVLFVLSARDRITEEQQSTFNTLQQIFESKIIDYLIVVFTGGDELEYNNLTLDDYLHKGCPEFLKRILSQCGDRKVLFDNRTKDKHKKAEQLKQLLAHIVDVGKQNGGIPYTDQMHRQIKEESDRLKEAKSKKLAAEAAEIIQLEYDEKMKQMAQTFERRLRENFEAHERAIRELKEALPPQYVLHNIPLSLPFTPQFGAPLGPLLPGCNIM